jgi:dTDP-4-dehydrorhamnose reductase
MHSEELNITDGSAMLDFVFGRGRDGRVNCASHCTVHAAENERELVQV